MKTNIIKMPVRVVLHDEKLGKWLDFKSPRQIVTTQQIDEVLSLIRQIEHGVRRDRLHAAGFISYEAAPAFDASLPAKADGDFPLLWFGLFEESQEISIPAGDAGPVPSIDWSPSVSHEEYLGRLRQIRNFIRDGDTYQVNFTYRLRARTDIDTWSLFVQMAGDGGSPFSAFVDTGEWAICSASPELFLRLDGERIESRPMKGTAPRGLWFEQDLENQFCLKCSEKERAENVMITDMVRNDLGRIARPGSVRVSSLYEVERYPTVWQMTSTVRARTGEPLDRILQATYPPASITGAPKRRTMEIIAGLECSPRRIYTGAIGYMAPEGRAQFNVAIRTVLLHKPTGAAEYGVGGGIVWDSKPENEYNECLTKTKVLRPSVRDFDLIETMLWRPGSGYELLDYHMKRLVQSADYFGFRMDLHRVMRKLALFAAGLSAGMHRVRLLVSRRGGARCEAVSVSAADLRFGEVALAESPVDKGNVFLYHKTTRRNVYGDARLRRPGCEDVLLFNALGEITESTMANVAVKIDGKMYTPPVHCGVLPGTRRAYMLDQGRLRERVISVQEVLGNPNVYLLNSVRGIKKVRIKT